jgi:hypothetical protein
MMDSPKTNSADDGVSKLAEGIASPIQRLFKAVGDRFDAKATGPGGKLSMAQQQAHFDNIAKLNEQSHKFDMAKMEKKAEIKSQRLKQKSDIAGPREPGTKSTIQIGKFAVSQTNAKAPAASKPSRPSSAGRSKPSRGGKK